MGFNDCRLRYTCKYTSLCGRRAPCSKKYCRFCSLCSAICGDYTRETCGLLAKAPYVCNGCEKFKKNKCTLEKAIYTAHDADKTYTNELHESRSGVAVDEDEVKRLNGILTPLIRNGQSIYHICENNRESLMCSQRTIYNYVDYRLFEALNLDLPRKVRYRPRKKAKDSFKVDRSCRIGRTYKDFLSFVDENPDIPIVEIDTVEGRKGGKVLLTIHFTEPSFMLAYLRDSNTSQSVLDVFNDLNNRLGEECFKKLFQVILTDNGSEFTNPSAIELDKNNNARTRLFYCDPSSPQQKPRVENNHEMIRKILPKGSSFDNLVQEDVQLMMNHINSYSRMKLNGKSPHEMFSFIYGSEALEQLGVSLVPHNEIILTSELFRRKGV